MFFRVYWVMIGFTFSRHFSSESRSYEAPAQLTECRVMLRLFEMPQPFVWVFKINAHIQVYFISLWCQGLSIHRKTVPSSMTKLFKQLIFHITMFLCHKSSFILKCCLLAEPAVQENHKFLNMLIQWGVGFHKPQLLHVNFLHFCPLRLLHVNFLHFCPLL